MLWAGILLIWELVGVDLTKAEATGGNVGAIITAIKSPQAVPWVLVILVAYFLFKCTVEWYQCSAARRKLRAAKIDFVSAWAVSLSAFALYFGQTISRVQFADFVQNSSRARALIIGFLIGAVFAANWMLILYARQQTGTSKIRWRAVIILLNCALLGLMVFGMFRGRVKLPTSWVSMLCGGNNAPHICSLVSCRA